MTSGLVASHGPAIESHSNPTHELPTLAKCSSPIGLNLSEYVALDLRLTHFLWMEEQIVPPVHHDILDLLAVSGALQWQEDFLPRSVGHSDSVPSESLFSTGIELCFPSDVLVHGFIALPSALFEVSVHVLTHLRELRQAKMLAKVS